MSRAVRTLVVAMGLAASAPCIASAHPLHTTITDLVEDRAHGTVRATIRIFADDFGTVVGKSSHGHPDAGSELAYVQGAFVLTDHGKRVALRSCGARREGAMVFFCVEAAATAGLSGVSVRNALLCDLYDDQVNIVQATVGTARKSVLFTKGDGAKVVG